jgi:hypothetical protein
MKDFWWPRMTNTAFHKFRNCTKYPHHDHFYEDGLTIFEALQGKYREAVPLTVPSSELTGAVFIPAKPDPDVPALVETALALTCRDRTCGLLERIQREQPPPNSASEQLERVTGPDGSVSQGLPGMLGMPLRPTGTDAGTANRLILPDTGSPVTLISKDEYRVWLALEAATRPWRLTQPRVFAGIGSASSVPCSHGCILLADVTDVVSGDTRQLVFYAIIAANISVPLILGMNTFVALDASIKGQLKSGRLHVPGRGGGPDTEVQLFRRHTNCPRTLTYSDLKHICKTPEQSERAMKRWDEIKSFQ